MVFKALPWLFKTDGLLAGSAFGSHQFMFAKFCAMPGARPAWPNMGDAAPGYPQSGALALEQEHDLSFDGDHKDLLHQQQPRGHG